MTILKRIQRIAYFTSRTAGDLDAARRGPVVLAKRLARREGTRAAFRLFGNGAGR